MEINETSAFRQAVAALNAKWEKEGWRQSPEHLRCRHCQADRVVWLTTIAGQTRAGCQTCRHTWVIHV
jgi:hypothetical protein